jgi:ferredoxin
VSNYYRDPEDRPLRTEPVRRDELLINPLYACPIRTMPLGTWRRVERLEAIDTPPENATVALPYAVADPALWRPVLDELAAAADEMRQSIEAIVHERPALAAVVHMPEPEPLPEFFLGEKVLEYRCEECGAWTLGIIWRRRLRLCSDRCAEAYRRRVYHDWRLLNPRDPETVNPTRAKRRAAARAGRTCEHCGKPIDAARATKRFCSDICRVRAHRTDPQERQRKQADRERQKELDPLAAKITAGQRQAEEGLRMARPAPVRGG